MSYQISIDNRILKVVFEGHLMTEELVALDKEIFDHWSKFECIGHIYDYRNVQTVGFSDEEIRRIALVDKNESFILGPMKIAIIVTDENIARFSRVYIQGLEGSDWQAKIMDNEQEAKAFVLA